MSDSTNFFTRPETKCPYCYLQLLNARGLRAHLPFCKDKKEIEQRNSAKHDPIPDPLQDELLLNENSYYDNYHPEDDFDDSINDGDVMTEDTNFISFESGFFGNFKLPNIVYENKHRDNGFNPELQQYGLSHPDYLNDKGIQSYSLMQEEFYDKNGIREALGASNLEEYCEIVQSKACNMSFKESRKEKILIVCNLLRLNSYIIYHCHNLISNILVTILTFLLYR